MYLALIDEAGTVQAVTEVADDVVVVDASRPYYITPGGWKPVTIDAPDAVAVGAHYDGKSFTPPPPTHEQKIDAALADLAKLAPGGASAAILAQAERATPRGADVQAEQATAEG